VRTSIAPWLSVGDAQSAVDWPRVVAHLVGDLGVPRLVLAALGDQAGCLGAALLARRALAAGASR